MLQEREVEVNGKKFEYSIWSEKARGVCAMISYDENKISAFSGKTLGDVVEFFQSFVTDFETVALDLDLAEGNDV